MATPRLSMSASVASTQPEEFTSRSTCDSSIVSSEITYSSSDSNLADKEITYNSSDSNLAGRKIIYNSSDSNLADKDPTYSTDQIKNKGMHRAASEPQTHILKKKNKNKDPRHQSLNIPPTREYFPIAKDTFFLPTQSLMESPSEPDSPIIPSHPITIHSLNNSFKNSEFAVVPNEKQNHKFKEFILSILKFLVAACSSSTFAINSDIGAGKSESLLFHNFHAPENLAALTKTGFTGPWYLNSFALIAGICSLFVNIYQFYDFAPQLREGYSSQIKPILKKIYNGKIKELTKKEYITLIGMVFAATAAAASGKIAWDATKDSPEWYFHFLLGFLNIASTSRTGNKLASFCM